MAVQLQDDEAASFLDDPTGERLRRTDNTLDGRFSNSDNLPLAHLEWSPDWQSLGQLDQLPFELLSLVLVELDVPSLAAVRQVNKSALALVDSLPQIRSITANCASVFRAIVATKASAYGLKTLHERLSTRDCTVCGCFAGYLYLITCTRVCYMCFTRSKQFFPLSEATVKRLGCKKAQMRHLPQLVSLPGPYTAFEKVSKRPMRLFDRSRVQQIARQDRWTAVLGRQVDYTTREGKRYMAIISAPYFGPDRTVDWGVYCLGCRDFDDPTHHMRSKYTRAAIQDHFRRFGILERVNGRLRHKG